MQARQTPFGFLVGLDRGEELIRALTCFARQNDVDTGLILGIGSLEELELGVGEQPHRRRVFREPLEACSLQGTIALLDGEPFPHVHGVFARADFSTVGGHIYEAVCARGLELVIHVAPEIALREVAHACGFTFAGTEVR